MAVIFSDAFFTEVSSWRLGFPGVVTAASAKEGRCVLLPNILPLSEGKIDLLGVGLGVFVCAEVDGTPFRLLNFGTGLRDGVSGNPPLLVGRCDAFIGLSREKKLDRLRRDDFGIFAILSFVRSANEALVLSDCSRGCGSTCWNRAGDAGSSSSASFLGVCSDNLFCKVLPPSVGSGSSSGLG